MCLRVFSEGLPKLILVTSNWEPQPLVVGSSCRSKISGVFLPVRVQSPMTPGHFFQILHFSTVSPFYSHTLIPSEMPFLRLSDSRNSKSGQRSPELPVYWVYLCPVQDEVIGHLLSGKYFQRIFTDVKRSRAISYYPQLAASQAWCQNSWHLTPGVVHLPRTSEKRARDYTKIR